jgi:hypothetical protein
MLYCSIELLDELKNDQIVTRVALPVGLDLDLARQRIEILQRC